MRRPLAGFALALVLLVAAPGVARAQGTLDFSLHFSRPELTLRTGAVQGVSTERDGGLAPYAEAQIHTRLARSAFGIAAHGGLSYERNERTARISCPFAGPCPDPDLRESYLDLVSGVRAGYFPARGPVDLFVGLAAHATRRSAQVEGFDDDPRTDWRLSPTAQAGIDVRLPLTSRLNVGLGAIGFVPIYSADDASLRGRDMSRVGMHLNFKYTL